MDLNSYIQLKEAYAQVGKPQQLTESVDSIWEEVEAFAHAMRTRRALLLSPTASGKSLIIYLLAKKMIESKKKILVIEIK